MSDNVKETIAKNLLYYRKKKQNNSKGIGRATWRKA